MNIKHYQEKRKIAFFSNYLGLYFVWVPGLVLSDVNGE